MDVILYYMKLEDKYWGLFLVALFLLFSVALAKSGEERKNYWFIAVYGLSAYLLFICPLTYRILIKIAPELSGYYELSHIELAVPVIAFAATIAAKKAWEQGKDKFGCFMIGMFLILFLAGDFVYLPTYKSEVRANRFQEEGEAFGILLAHAESRGDETIRLWAMDDFMAQSRLYQEDFRPVYGKDMEAHPENYSESLRNLHMAYNSYDSEKTNVVNLKEQLDALGSFPFLYPDVECEYFVIYNPEVQFSDEEAAAEYEKYVAVNDYDPRKNISGLGYEFIGETESYLLFYRAGSAAE